MKKELKDLLVKDTCSRLAYKTKYQVEGEDKSDTFIIGGYIRFEDDYFFNFIISEGKVLDFKSVCDIKPYLLPISSMPEEHRKEYISTFESGISSCRTFDWLNEHHYDYRHLIDESLAIDATNLNIY